MDSLKETKTGGNKMYKASELTVKGEKAFFLVKGLKYFPNYKFSTLEEATECALKENMYFHYNKAKSYFDKLVKMSPAKYGENSDGAEYTMADLLC